MKFVFILMSVAVISGAECVSIARDRIVARDLAGVIPIFGLLDPET